MPDRIFNPYQYKSPIGDALKQFGDALMSGPTEAQRIAQAEQALKLKNTRESTASLGELMRQMGQPGFDRGAVMQNAVVAGYDPQRVAEFERWNAANAFGVDDPRVSNAFVGAGGAYGSTPRGYREGQATEMSKARMVDDRARYEFANKPYVIGSETGPVVVPQSQAYGQPAVEDIGKVKGDILRRGYNAPGGLAEQPIEVQRLVGAESKAQGTPRNYVFQGKPYITNDGITDARTGQPLPEGGYLANPQGAATDVGLRPTVQGKLQEADIAGQRLKALVNYTRNLAQDPTNFGVTGMAKGLFQDATQLAGNIATGLGYNGVQDAVVSVQRKAVANGINPGILSGVFDRNLPALHTAADLLVFSAAEALAGQSGRNVSDKDVKLFKGIVGDPQSLMASREQYLAKLDTIEQILGINLDVTNQQLRRDPAAPAAPGAAPSSSVQAPGAPSPPLREKWERGPDGRLRRVQ